jgi:hypothetical protein
MTTATAIPVRRRPELVLQPAGDQQDDRGEHVVKDPGTGSYFSLGAQEVFLLLLLDGRRSVGALCAAFEERFAEPLSAEDLQEFLVLAGTNGLLDVPASPAPASPRTLLSWRRNLFNPDRLLTWLEPKVRFFWTFDFLAFSAWWVVGAAVLVGVWWRELPGDVAGALRWDMLAPLLGTVVIATMLHEMAHGLTCKHYDGEVREVGVLLLCFAPCLYCNVSDAWLFREKSKRLWVTLAGSYCDLCLCAGAVFVWRPRKAGPGGWPWPCWRSAARVLFNLNPLLKLDGYYLLGDSLAIPNLQERSWDYTLACFSHRLEGGPKPQAEARGGVLLGYGVASWLFAEAYLTLMLAGLGCLGCWLAAALGTAAAWQ